MCGIVGLFLKDKALEPQLGAMLSDMLVSLGPRSGQRRHRHLRRREGRVGQDHRPVGGTRPGFQRAGRRAARGDRHPGEGDGQVDTCGRRGAARQGSTRRARRSVKLRPCGPHHGCRRVGRDLQGGRAARTTWSSRFDIAKMAGTHGIGHTRMATESAVTTLGAHPFSTGPDQCLVHNGSLSNHNNLRRELIQRRHDLRDRERHRGRGRLSHRRRWPTARTSARR